MNKISNIAFQGTNKTSKKENKKNKANISGAIGAAVTGAVAKNGVGIAGIYPLCNMLKLNKKLTEDQIEKTANAAKKAMETSGLSSKVILNDYQHVPFYSQSTKNIKEGVDVGLTMNIDKKVATPLANGQNAFFVGKIPKHVKKAYSKLGIVENSVNVNLKKLPLSSFHEIGHAINYNKSAFWKGMQKARGPLTILAGVLALIPAVTKNIKAKEGEELTGKQKFNNNLRKASPFLAAGAMLPMFAEEIMATVRGNGLAKKLLDPDLAKKVSKTNAWGAASYAIATLAVGISTFVAKKIKDSSDEKKSLENEQNNCKQTYQG